MSAASSIVKVFEEFGSVTKEELQASLRTKGVTYGGQDSRLSNKIEFDIKQQGDSIVFQLSMPDYYEYVDSGRAPTKSKGDGTVQDRIEAWVKRKGLVGKFMKGPKQKYIYKKKIGKKIKKQGPPKKRIKRPGSKFEKAARQLAFLITRKIHQKGYKGNHFFSDVIKNKDNKELLSKLTEVMKKEVIIEIKGS